MLNLFIQVEVMRWCILPIEFSFLNLVQQRWKKVVVGRTSLPFSFNLPSYRTLPRSGAGFKFYNNTNLNGMPSTTATTNGNMHSGLIRTGGVAMLVTLVIHIVANDVLKELPPDNPTPEELIAYLTEEQPTWSIVHGMRYVAVVCIAIFIGGLCTRLCLNTSILGWPIVGLIGACLHLASLMITNGIETVAYLDVELSSDKPELFWLLFQLTDVLFTAEVTAGAIVMLGFSMAGLNSKMLPKWIVAIGLLGALASLVSGALIVSVVQSGWASNVHAVAGFLGLIWFGSCGVYLLIKGGLP
jgi:hypothetical protein